MPRLSVWFVRASLVYLFLGFTFGALILADKGIPYDPRVWSLFPIHIEFLLIGWLVQLAMGVAFWILPRFGLGAPRGNVRLVGVSFVMINVGLLISVLQLWLPVAILIGRVFEAGAGIIFVTGLWRRVKPHGALYG